MSIKDAKIYRSKNQIKVFPFDPEDKFTNVIIKRDKKEKFIAATLVDTTGHFQPSFIDPGQRVFVSVKNEAILHLISDDKGKTFDDNWEVLTIN